MRSKNRNFKKMRAVGLAGMLVAGLVAGSLPAEPVSAANGWEIPLNNYGESLSQSSVSITISGSGNEVLNADRGIAQGMIKRTASVAFGATDGYRVTVSGNPNLTGTNTKKTIPSAALTLSNMVNQWGWYAVNGAADCSASNVYKAMSTTGTQIDSGTLGAGATKTYTMCFGMRVDTGQAADSYGGSVTVSAVAEPGTIRTGAFNGVTYMQDMTANICANAKENETAQLIDRRDSKKYWVTKMLDGNCWMSQNLALDITREKTESSYVSNIDIYTSDITSSYVYGNTAWGGSNTSYAPLPTFGNPTNLWTGAHSYNFGEYVVKLPTSGGTSCSSGVGLSECSNEFVSVEGKTASSNPNFYKDKGVTYTSTEYDAHYLAGNYYQWYAATAGAGGTASANANASGSICPKGWKLPSSGGTSDLRGQGTFYHLLVQYGIDSSSWNSSPIGTNSSGNKYNALLSPLFLVMGGSVYVAGDSQIQDAGSSGRYWSSRMSTSAGNALFLSVSGNYIYSSNNTSIAYAESVRCLFPAS